MPMRIPILYRSKGHYMLHIFYFEVKAKRKGEHAQVLISPHHSASAASIRRRTLKFGFRTYFDANPSAYQKSFNTQSKRSQAVTCLKATCVPTSLTGLTFFHPLYRN